MRPLQKGSFFQISALGSYCNPRNTQCIPVVNPHKVDRLLPLKVRDLRLDLEQISADFELKLFETGSLVFKYFKAFDLLKNTYKATFI